MTAFHLIAVNCHEFHEETAILASIASVEAAVAHFRAHRPDPVEARIYWQKRQPPSEPVRTTCARAGFALRTASPASNGENLNRQIDDAMRDGADTFFRVDGDDMVTPHRFVQQAELLTSGTCDMCGGGLRYVPTEGNAYEMLPRARPGARDFVENQFVLHPSLGMRLDAFQRAGLRYWTRRLEDKALLLDASTTGLRIRNLPVILGTYRLDPGARNLLTQKWLNLRLNLRFLVQARSFGLVPYALLLFALHVMLGSDRLRRVRFWMRTGAPRRGPSTSPSEDSKPVTS